MDDVETLLKLAREAIKLFRKAEDHCLRHRCMRSCSEWERLQNNACIVAIDFEVKDNGNL